MNTLAERAVLMRLALGLPGETRQDAKLTSEVKFDHGLGEDLGNWIKRLYPPAALAEVKKLDNEVRAYHANLTLPFDKGIGILPAALIAEYGDRMRELKNRREMLRDEFLRDPERWIVWAVQKHNGAFDPSLYPGCWSVEPVIEAATGKPYRFDAEEFKRVMFQRFDFQTQPLPVPHADHFCGTVASLLGTDVAMVDQRVREAELEGQRELMRRMLEPVANMAKKLAEDPKLKKNGKVAEDIVFRDSMVGNLVDICRIAPALNIGCDPVIDGFIAEIEALTRYTPEVLRDDKATRAEAQKKADDIMKRLSGYSL